MPEPRQSRLSIAARLGILWCTVMHNAPTWPIRGNYRCRKCRRTYLVPWASLSQQSGAKKDQTRLGSLACRICMQV
jgi:hypothetical protein